MLCPVDLRRRGHEQADLRRYYAGEAGLWGEVQASVHAELLARGLSVMPRHLRFRRNGDGYDVMVEDAEEHLTGL